MADIKDPENTLVMETSKGTVVIEMRPDLAPNHVAHIKKLVREKFYDGIVFHRVIEGFMAQTGCPHGTGTGGSKYPDLNQEFNAEPHVRGTVSMARAMNPQLRQLAVLHLLRRRPLPGQAVHGVGQGHRGHGERRQDQAWRTRARSRQDHFGRRGGRRGLTPAHFEFAPTERPLRRRFLCRRQPFFLRRSTQPAHCWSRFVWP